LNLITNFAFDYKCCPFIKVLEDAIYSFGAGVSGDARRACANAAIDRPIAEVTETALTLLDMIGRVG